MSLLILLLSHPGSVVTREQIRHHVWAPGEFVDFEHAVNTAVVKIRNLLKEHAGTPYWLETVTGVGYKLHGPVATMDVVPAPTAHPSFVRAKLYVAQRSPESLFRAYEHLLMALHDFPHSAEVLASLAEVNRLLCISECIHSELAFDRAASAVESAVRCDSNASIAWSARGGFRCRFRWEWEAGARDLLHAISLDNTSAEAHSTYGMVLAAQGRFTEAQAMLRRATAISPSSPILHVLGAQVLVAERRYMEAGELLEGVLLVAPDFSLARLTYGLALLGSENFGEAIASLESALRMSHEQPLVLSYLSSALLQAGQVTAAEKVSRQVQAAVKTRVVAPSTMAYLASSETRWEDAIGWAERCVDAHDPVFAMLRHAPCFDPLRHHDGFMHVLRRMCLEP